MTAKNITLRPGRPDDAEKIAMMSRDLIETGLGWSWGPDRVSRSLRNKDTLTVIACDRDRIVAFAIMYFGEEHAHLNLLAVRPSHQRLGIGRRMCRPNMPSVARREAVARLDEFVGPKW